MNLPTACPAAHTRLARWLRQHPTRQAWRISGLGPEVALYFALQPPALADEAWLAGWRPQPAADVAGLLDFAGGTDAEPSDPFTVFGNVRKKYLIEQRAGEKILGRTKGFTVEACAEGVAVAADSLQYPPNRTSPAAPDGGRCQQVEGAELAPACVSACRAACGNAVEQYAVLARSTTGFAVADDAQARASRACSRECAYECNKPGKFYGFQVTSRR
ncbi:hypothetical protein WJX81_008439 [Elliptochloris bilobata]|uniref:Uncharacterized protein n=1 Tax=Elliptochloris bilobata TaxID=381761 RepID=A0AAW1RLD8_9CHLO